MSIEVNRRWAVHINIELARVGAHERVVSEARARSVAIVSSQDGILRPGELALVALVQLPDGAGVDAAWGALGSIPDVDATVERWSQEEAAEEERVRLATPPTSNLRLLTPEEVEELRRVDTAANLRWSAALAAEAAEAEPVDAELAGRFRAALTVGIRSEHEARLVLAAAGYGNPDAVKRVLFGDSESSGPTLDEVARMNPAQQRALSSGVDEPRQGQIAQELENLRAAGLGLALDDAGAACAPETPAPGAMRPETRRRIEEAVMWAATHPPPKPAPHYIELATGEAEAALDADTDAETDLHLLRAIAYLVRRLELEAPEQPQTAPAGAIRKGALVRTMKRGCRRAYDAWGRMGGAYGEVVSNPEGSVQRDTVSVRLGSGAILPYLIEDLELVSAAAEQGRDEPR